MDIYHQKIREKLILYPYMSIAEAKTNLKAWANKMESNFVQNNHSNNEWSSFAISSKLVSFFVFQNLWEFFVINFR